jgi:hypothetical protein
MASRSGGGAGWFIVGFLAGVGATLAVLIFATRPQPTRVAIPPLSAPAAPVVTYHAPEAPYAGPAQQPAPAAAQSSAPAPAAEGPAQAAPDLQTQEDAAAAGMTSRARRGG